MNHAELSICDITGRHIETLVSSILQSGNHQVEWNAINYPSGIYFARLQAGSFSECRKLVLLK